MDQNRVAGVAERTVTTSPTLQPTGRPVLIAQPPVVAPQRTKGAEWSSPHNPFNSVKALYWGSFIEQFHAGERPAPITADIEPTNACNINCRWCYPMQTGYRANYRAHMDTARLVALPGFLKDWGVRCAQVTGGGEPLFHPEIKAFLAEMRRVALPMGLITNGVLLQSPIIDLLHDFADWIGFSMDAGTGATWSDLKGRPARQFDRIIANMEELNRRKQGVRVAYKYLINASNYREVLTAARLAKETGCDDFHLRPTYNFGAFGEVDFDEVNDILDAVKSYEGDGFRVFTIQHKFSNRLSDQVLDFPQCLATPLLLTFSADHNAYLCLDHRGEAEFALASFAADLQPVKDYWGGPEHLARLRAIEPAQCKKCTFKGYNDLFNGIGNMMVSYL
jgi:MoaA/NifB/PqqE/SkfB family radical SAM enzyme